MIFLNTTFACLSVFTVVNCVSFHICIKRSNFTEFRYVVKEYHIMMLNGKTQLYQIRMVTNIFVEII